MSHWSDVKTEFVSLDMIEKALRDLGTGKTRLLRGATTALGYGSNTKTCDHVIRGGIHYDVAVIVDKETGAIGLTTDFYTYKNGGPKETETVPVGEVLGREYTKLKAYYAAHKSYAEAKRRGVRTNMHRITNGVHEVKNTSGKWVTANATLWSKIKGMMPFKEIKKENASRLWVQCDV